MSPSTAAALAEFGGAVALARKERGLSQAELGERCGMPQPRIAEIEAGRRNLTWTTTLKIAEALGMRWDAMLKDWPHNLPA